MYGEDFETNEWMSEKQFKLFWMIYFYSKNQNFEEKSVQIKS